MTVNLSTLKVGDKVKRRSGGVLTVKDIITDDEDGTYCVHTYEDRDAWWYDEDGVYYGTYLHEWEEPKDIVEIIPQDKPEESTVDLTKLKAGDTVHFRCGGSATVSDVQELRSQTRYFLRFGKSIQNAYVSDGGFSLDTNPHPFDIIRIEPKAFDWADVKQGMAFEDPTYGIVHFVGVSLKTQNGVPASAVFEVTGDIGPQPRCFARKIGSLVRAPQYDLEV